MACILHYQILPAVIIGLMYPYLDELLSKSPQHRDVHIMCSYEQDNCHQQEPHKQPLSCLHSTCPHQMREWSSVMRCVAIFVGINHASAVSVFVNFFNTYTGLQPMDPYQINRRSTLAMIYNCPSLCLFFQLVCGTCLMAPRQAFF